MLGKLLKLVVSTSLALGLATTVLAQSPGPLRIELNRGVIEPMPVAIPDFVSGSSRVGDLASQITAVI